MMGVSAQYVDVTNLKALARRLSSGLTVLFVVNGPIKCVHLETILLHVNMYLKIVENHEFLPHSSILIVIFFSSYFHLFFLFYLFMSCKWIRKKKLYRRHYAFF